MVTRSLAIVPAVFVASSYGADGATTLLPSQVMLSFQLIFAMVLPVPITSDFAVYE